MPFLALPFPAIDPVLIHIGPLAIRWYALGYIVGGVMRQRFSWSPAYRQATGGWELGLLDRPATARTSDRWARMDVTRALTERSCANGSV